MEQITPHLWQIDLSFVNAFVIEDDDGSLTLVDTGVRDRADRIEKAIRKAGKDPARIGRIILTHCHPDHAGSLAEMKRRTGALVLAHPLDAALVQQGIGKRPGFRPSPGLKFRLLYGLIQLVSDKGVEPCAVDEELADGQVLPIGGGARVVHAPGHSAGQVCLLLEQDRALIAADICGNLPTLDLSVGYEDLNLGKATLRKLAKLDFDTAVFGHGGPLKGEANRKIAARFS